MAYKEIENALANQIGSIAGFSTAAGSGNIGQGDYRVVSRGNSSSVVLEYNGFDQRLITDAGGHFIDWRVNVMIFSRWKDEKNAYDLMGSIRQSIIDRVNRYPELGLQGTVFHSLIESGDTFPEEIDMGGVRYAIELLRCIATEDISVSYAE